VSSIAYNVLQLGEVAEIEEQMFSFVQKFNRRTAVGFSTEPAILPNCCYGQAFYGVSVCINVRIKFIESFSCVKVYLVLFMFSG
jgi:hypothetical protein